MNFSWRNYGRLLIIAPLIIISDQASKYLILQTMPLYESIPVIPGFFHLTHIHNTGGAFGVFADSHPMLRKILFLFISSVAILLILYLYHKTSESYPFLSAGFALIFGGAAGNMIDRIRFGKVVDFLDFFIGKLHWPAFNIADSAITVGIGIFMYYVIVKKVEF